MKQIKLNSEIKKQADELFALIEKEVKEKHEDDVAGAMAKEWGDYLKGSKGFEILKYGEELTLTESERAVFGLEDSFYRMNDEAAGHIMTVTRNTLRLLSMWDFSNDKPKAGQPSRITGALMMANDSAKFINSELDGLFDYRSQSYREEIEELKAAV